MTGPGPATFGNGTPYVQARTWRRFLAWLVDFIVYLLGVVAGFVVLAAVFRNADLADGVLVGFVLGLLFVVPLLYGLCYRGGRALGAVLTGTRLVRLSDGGRIGAKGPWAMLIRTVLLPLLLIVVIGGVLGGGGGAAPGGSQTRVSVDARRGR